MPAQVSTFVSESPQLCDCGHPPSTHESFTTGYGRDDAGQTACYECCATIDRARMLETNRAVLYLKQSGSDWYVSNWPGSLKFRTNTPRKGRHNIASTRYDVWFTVNNETWHGIQYGEDTQLCHCRRIKD